MPLLLAEEAEAPRGPRGAPSGLWGPLGVEAAVSLSPSLSPLGSEEGPPFLSVQILNPKL